jgi:hypothetical protein
VDFTAFVRCGVAELFADSSKEHFAVNEKENP